jgi:uncharacterized membrane protein YkoI
MKRKVLFSLVILSSCFLFNACNDQDDADETIELPEVILNYLSENYPDYNIDESEEETLCDGTLAYEVELENNDNDEVELTFNTEGTFLYSEEEIKRSDLPQAVKDNIDTAYSGFNIKEAEELALNDGDIQYEVELKDGGNKLEVLFAQDGTVLCEAEDD